MAYHNQIITKFNSMVPIFDFKIQEHKNEVQKLLKKYKFKNFNFIFLLLLLIF